MSKEITVSASLGYANPTQGVAAKALQLAATQFDITGDTFTQGVQLVPTTAGGTAIPLGGMNGTPGWIIVINRDGTNNVDLMSAVSGTAFARLKPGECALFRYTPALTAPAALAFVGACLVEYLLIEA